MTNSENLMPVGFKESNPKDLVGMRKVPFHVIPAEVTAEVGLAMLEGACKYGSHNYRTVGVRASVYYDAALRHLTSFWEGQDVDPESGLPHIVKCLACLYVLRDSQRMGNWVDDRPPVIPSKDNWISELNNLAASLIEKYPEPKPAHVEKKDGNV